MLGATLGRGCEHGACGSGIGRDKGRAAADRRRGPHRRRATARARHAVQAQRPFRERDPRGDRRRLGIAGERSKRSRRMSTSRSRARSSPRTTRPTFPSTARSTPIAAASMAASIVSRGRPTPIWASRRGSISRRRFSSRRAPRSFWSANLSAPNYTPKDDRDRHQHRSLSAAREAPSRHALDSRSAGARQTSGRPSSPNRRWSCAISIFSRRWPVRVSPRSRSRVTTLDPQARADHGAARRDAGAPARHHRKARRRRRPRRR